MINKLNIQQNPTKHTSHITNPRKTSEERKAAIARFDTITISEEAKAAATEMRERWNSGEMSYEEKQAFMMERHGIPFRAADGSFPGLTDEQVADWHTAQANRNRELLAQSSHNLLGAFEFTANNGQLFTARLGMDGIWLLNEHNALHDRRDSFIQIDPSRGVPGIDQPTIRKLDFMLRISQGLNTALPPQDNNLYSQEGITGNADGLRALVESFSAIRSNTNGQAHVAPLESAFRLLVTNFFDESARVANFMPEGATPTEAESNAWFEQTEAARYEARNQADEFVNTFLDNLSRYGADEAFNMAWANVQTQ